MKMKKVQTCIIILLAVKDIKIPILWNIQNNLIFQFRYSLFSVLCISESLKQYNCITSTTKILMDVSCKLGQGFPFLCQSRILIVFSSLFTFFGVDFFNMTNAYDDSMKI